MRTAIIDLGTNTFHLLISDGKHSIHEERRAVRLGMGGINKGIILPDARRRAMDCLRDYAALARQHGAGAVLAFGTSALRSAANGAEVCEEIKSETGITVRIIGGDEEAILIWEGVRAAMDLGDDPGLIVDIGGGSVEFIIANRHKIHWKKSIEAGGQRLIERFQHHDPILPSEVQDIEQYIDDVIEPVQQALKSHGPRTLFGSSGSFDTISEMHCRRSGIPYPSDPETPLTFESFQNIHQDLLTLDRSGRMALPGMIELRVDMIVVASILIRYLLHLHPFTSIRVSAYSLKEGVRAGLLRAVQ